MNNKIIHKKLKNGLNIYLCPNKKNHTTTIELIVKYGGFYSDFISNGKKYHLNDGMAHLLEHLMVEKNSEGNFLEIFGNKQMRTNACTWPWITEYFVDTVENVEYAIEKLIKGLSIPVFTKEDIEITKPAIYQEIKMHADQLSRQVLYTSTKNIFKNLTYINGLGTKENVESFTYEQVKMCYDTFYQPSNEILFISGNFSTEEIFQKIKDIYENIDNQKITFKYLDMQEPKEVLKEYEVINMITKKDYIDICYKIDVKDYSVEQRRMLSYYLGLFLHLNFSKISPVYKELIEKNIIENSISTNHDFYQNYLIINARSYVNDEEKFIKSIKNVFQNDHYFSKERFDLQLKKIKIKTICSDATSYGTAKEFVDNILYYDYPGFDTIEELNQLNHEDYLKFIDSLKFDNFTITKVTNFDNKNRRSKKMAFDYKKEYKEFYIPKNKPSIVKIPKMNYLAVRGFGDPNKEDGEYKKSIGLLYAIAFTIKMSYKTSYKIDGYFAYVVPPLEGFWWSEGLLNTIDYQNKDKLHFISLIRLPDFVTKKDFEWAINEATKKKNQDFSQVEYLTYEEGFCVQCMHIGSYDDEPETIELMHKYIEENGYELDINPKRFHHEIYLSDPRRCDVNKLKTVIRHPIKKKNASQ